MLKNAANVFRENYKVFYIAVLLIFVAVFSHSRYLLSMSEIGLFVFWLLEGKFSRKIKVLKERKEALFFASIFILHTAGLIYTQNFDYAFKDLRVKLPVLLFPLVLATSPRLSGKETKLILSVFILSVFAKTVYGIFVLSKAEVFESSLLAGRFSHIRYALLLNIAAFSAFYYSITKKTEDRRIFRVLYFLVFLWFSVFILILHSVTGWIVYLSLFLFSILFFLFNIKEKRIKILSVFLVFLMIAGIGIFLTKSAVRFYKKDDIVAENLDKYTSEGNKYVNNLISKQTENGHYVYVYLCEKELKDEWNKLSDFKYEGKDKKGQDIKFTLIRYLTSKNLRKDREGVKSLTGQDIKNIENGMTNYIFADKYSVYSKIYEILWQAERYLSGGNADNQSVSQRIEFLKAGKEIVKRNFWFGTGTGDVKDEFQKQYEKSGSKLSEKHRLRAHNQYVTMFIAFGLFGFVWFLFAYLYPVIKTKKYKDYLFLVSFIVISLSMLNEDTLETQMGATIFAFFLSFFMFAGESVEKFKN